MSTISAEKTYEVHWMTRIYLSVLDTYSPQVDEASRSCRPRRSLKKIDPDLTLSQRFMWVISDQGKKASYLFLEVFTDGDCMDFHRNQFQKSTISSCRTPHYILYPFYLVHYCHRKMASLPFCKSVLHSGRSVIACFLDICSCCCPLSEECSEFILLKFSAFNLLGLFEEADDVRHSLAIAFLLVCIASQNKRDVSLWPWLLDSTITH